MDVSLSGRRVFFLIGILSLGFVSCGNRYDLSSAAGQQARIDDANMYLSRGDCADAENAINPLYASQYVTDQVRIVKASAEACYAHFNLLTFAANAVSSSNFFVGLATSLDNTPGDGARQALYNAVDVLTQNGSTMSASQRSVAANDYMMFLQFGILAAIERNYGSPDTSGNKHTNLVYPGGNLSNVDGCAVGAAFSITVDSFSASDLSDSTTKSNIATLNNMCASAGVGACTSLNRDRTQCDGVNANSVKAGAIVSSVNSNW